MLYSQPFDWIPLWGVFLLTVSVVLLAIEAGYRIGKFRSRSAGKERESPVAATVAATLALLGFMLAFTFNMAGTRFDARRQAVLDEANAIGTTFLRAGCLPDDQTEPVRKLLRSYVNARLQAIEVNQLEASIRRSGELQGELWLKAESLAKKYPNSLSVAQFIQSLNATIDLHETRVITGLVNRVPPILWFTLYVLTLFGMMGVGYHAGLTSKVRSFSFVILTLTFSSVLLLVADLDRPQEGMVRVSQQALHDLQSTLDDPRWAETGKSG